MRFLLKYNLPFVEISASYYGAAVDIPDVLIDTGSASTILSADFVESIGIIPENNDIPHIVTGVGGSEVVYNRRVDYLKIGVCGVQDFEVEIGGMGYGFEINGILGMDFMKHVEAIINLRKMIIEFNVPSNNSFLSGRRNK